AATQPIMYQTIRKHPSVLTIYSSRLQDLGVVSKKEVEEIAESYRACLDEGRNPNDDALGMLGNKHTVDWSRYQLGSLGESVDTGVPLAELKRLAALMTRLPDDFSLHPRVQRIIDDRRKMAAGDLALDWGFAESIAYATLLAENFHVRLIGRDRRRRTFFHRLTSIIN